MKNLATSAILGFAALALAGCSFSVDSKPSADDPAPAYDLDAMTCDQLADEVVNLSADDDSVLLKIGSLETLNNKWETAEDLDQPETLVCSGWSVWSDATARETEFWVSVDEEGDEFIHYETSSGDERVAFLDASDR